jgi:DNA-binding response OmpR family regulator
MSSILLIDDDHDLRIILTELLRSAGHTVDTASDGKTGLALYRAGLHDLVITDIMMPDMDGLELIDDLRKAQTRPRIIAMSGASKVALPFYLSNARQIGAQRVLAKPIDSDVLLQTVTAVLAEAAPAPFIRRPSTNSL